MYISGDFCFSFVSSHYQHYHIPKQWKKKINYKKRVYVYIYTRFQKGFHMERYIDRYILLFSCNVRSCAFLTCHFPTCEKSRFNEKFSLCRVLCLTLKKTFQIPIRPGFQVDEEPLCGCATCKSLLLLLLLLSLSLLYHYLFFRLKNAFALQYRFTMVNHLACFGNEETSPRSSRVIRRHPKNDF